ncbi:MAG TPA: hypothetical protein VFV53_03445 [Candidatus Limnocylindrales bacterium]|nr:hypothetical protein [Candidatus Limnocylindrales bacterium]
MTAGSGDREPVMAPGPPAADTPRPGRRPLVERLGMAFIAGVLAVLFSGMAVASWANGEAFLAVMAGVGALMTAWAGAITLFRG